MVKRANQVQAEMAEQSIPRFETRHRLSLALEYSGIDVQEMASYLGISRTTVSNYLHGRTPTPRPVLMLWAMRTGVPLDWLVTGVEPEGEPSHDDDGERTPRQVRRRRAWTADRPVLVSSLVTIPRRIAA